MAEFNEQSRTLVDVWDIDDILLHLDDDGRLGLPNQACADVLKQMAEDYDANDGLNYSSVDAAWLQVQKSRTKRRYIVDVSPMLVDTYSEEEARAIALDHFHTDVRNPSSNIFDVGLAPVSVSVDEDAQL